MFQCHQNKHCLIFQKGKCNKLLQNLKVMLFFFKCSPNCKHSHIAITDTYDNIDFLKKLNMFLFYYQPCTWMNCHNPEQVIFYLKCIHNGQVVTFRILCQFLSSWICDLFFPLKKIQKKATWIALIIYTRKF